jgi:hypothetical protein
MRDVSTSLDMTKLLGDNSPVRDLKLARKIKALVLTWDRNRAMTEHTILQYERVWPGHPFVFHIPYQEIGGTDTEKSIYIKSPPAIRATVFRLIENLDDEEWIYWCMDDRYPIRLETEKIERMIANALQSSKMSGLLFCRCRRLLNRPKQTLFRREWIDRDGNIYFQRRGWSQIWIHQLMKVKVLRHLFTHLPEELPNANAMDKLKHEIVMPRDFRLFVTKENFAIFGESTRRGLITQNCYESITQTQIELPEWFQIPNGENVTLGVL